MMLTNLQKILGLISMVLFVTGASLAQEDQAEPVFEVIANFDQTSVNDLGVSPDGSILAVATTTGIWLYNTTDLTLHSSLVLEEKPEVTTLSWSPETLALAAGYEDGVRIWNIEKREVSWSYLKIPDVTHVAWGYDYRLAVLNSGFVERGMVDFIFTDLRVLIPYTDDVLMRKTDIRENTNQLIWSPDGTQLLYLDQVGGFVFSDIICEPLIVHPYLWSEEGGKNITPVVNDDPFPLRSIAWSPDGTYIAMDLRDPCTTMAELQIRDSSGVLIKTLPSGSMPAWSADGAYFVTYGENMGEHGFWIWDRALENSRFMRSENIKQFVISPDGTRLYANHWGEIAVYTLISGN